MEKLHHLLHHLSNNHTHPHPEWSATDPGMECIQVEWWGRLLGVEVLRAIDRVECWSWLLVVVLRAIGGGQC